MRLQATVAAFFLMSGLLAGSTPTTGQELSAKPAFGSRTMLMDELRRVHQELVELRDRTEHPAGHVSLEELETLAKRVESMGAEAHALADQGDTVAERKRHQLEVLLESLKAHRLHGAAKKDLETLGAVGADGVADGTAVCAEADLLRLGSWLVRRENGQKSHGTRWYRLPAPFTGRFHIDTFGSAVDTRLSLHETCDGPPIRHADDTRGLAAGLGFEAQEGQVTWLRLDGEGPGHVTLSRRGVPFESTDPTKAPTLRKGGEASVVRGVVTDSSGAPLEGVRIRMSLDYDYTVASAVTDATGAYEVTGLAPGEYRARTSFYSSSDSYLNQIYPLTNCSGSCSLDLGEALVLDGANTLDSIDFRLLRGSGLSGWVQDGETGVGIGSVQVEIWDAEAQRLRSDYTDPAGRWTLDGLLPGDYQLTAEVRTHQGAGWGGVPCPDSCDEPVGSVISLAQESHLSGLNFALVRQGGIAGQVLDDAGAPLAYVGVTAYSADGSRQSSGQTDSSGHYSLNGILAGPTFVVAGGYRLVDELWPGIPCDGCDVTTGTPVAVVDREVTPDIDFMLDRFAIVTGVARGPEGASGYSGRVSFYDAKGQYVAKDYPDSDGEYRVDLRPGTYYAVASATTNYKGEAWDDRPCDTDCDPLIGDPITVGANVTLENVDFLLTQKGSISGLVTHRGVAELSSSVDVVLYDESGAYVDYRYAYETDPAFYFRGLEAGTYYLGMTSTYGPYMPEMYEDVFCGQPCDPLSGTPIVVSEGAAVENLELELSLKPVLRGTVTDLADGEVVEYARIYLFDDSGAPVDDVTAYNGSYRFYNLQPGTYFMVAQKSGYVAQLWQGMDCYPSYAEGGCTITDGTPVVLTIDTETEIDFQLDRRGSLGGQVTDQETGEPIWANITVYDSTGREVGRTNASSADGMWELTGLVDGTYRVQSRPYSQYMKLAWPSTYCSGGYSCTDFSGTLITVSGGAAVAGIDFDHRRLGTISGRLTDAETGEPLSGRYVYVYTSSGQSRGYDRTQQDGTFVLESLSAGTFYVATSGNRTYRDEVYGGGICESSCLPTGGTPIPLALFGDVAGIDIDLGRSKGVRGRITSRSSGMPLAGVAVDFWWQPSYLARTVVTDADGRFEAIGLSSSDVGSFYVSTHNPSGYVDQLWGGVQCPAGSAFDGLCDVTLGTLYEQREDEPIFEMNFVLEDSPSIDSIIFSSSFEDGLAGWSSVSGL